MANVIGEPGSLSSYSQSHRRVLSALVAFALAVALLPFGVITALLIWIETPGSPIFRQSRLGLDEAPFFMFKFRTMRRNSAVGIEKSPQDERVTRLGWLMRRTSWDEVPQLINVVLGNMCFVGPRPELPELLGRYDDQQRARFTATPGLTGLWQVSGRSNLSLDDKISLDLQYICNKSLKTDLLILARTPFAVISARGAH